jgi:hypothetical protein
VYFFIKEMKMNVDNSYTSGFVNLPFFQLLYQGRVVIFKGKERAMDIQQLGSHDDSTQHIVLAPRLTQKVRLDILEGSKNRQQFVIHRCRAAQSVAAGPDN